MMLNAYIQFKSIQITKDNIGFEPVIVFFILPTDQKRALLFKVTALHTYYLFRFSSVFTRRFMVLSIDSTEIFS